MSDRFRYRVQIARSPTDVYAALTTDEGIQGWWTPDCEVASEIGGRSHFRFGEMYHTYEILTLLPGREVQWQCVDHYHNLPELTKFDEWVGTRLIFRLSSSEDGGTVLDFEHIGLTPDLECFNHCSERWPFFLGVSMKQFLETGTGRPYIDREPE
ncbi:MAG: SRPBCC domain-containing protein [Phycisphaerales bacterium]|nr:SRPBCC domain-containing protein [Phycisphaerales bacterium]